MIAPVAENAGHVEAVEAVDGMTRTDLDPYLGRALAGDGVGTALASAVGGSPTTTYAANIGVMAATRIYSTHRLLGGRGRRRSTSSRSPPG